MNKKDVVKMLICNSGSSVTLYSRTRLNSNSYKLQFNCNPYRNIKIKKTPVISEEDVSINKKYLQKLTASEDIFRFISVLSNEKKDIKFIILYHNLDDLQVQFNNFKVSNFFFRKKECGYYLPEYNILVIDKNGDKCTIYHELFHVSTSLVDRYGNVYSGFGQSNGNFFIGEGIDEGYTELLTKRYFKEDYKENCYIFEVLVVSLLEEVIGREKMEQLYFKCDLYNLVMELKKYSSFEETMKFIYDLDFYNKFSMSWFNLVFNREILKSCLNDIACYLIKLLYTKQLLEPENVDVRLVKEFSKKLKRGLYCNKKKFYYFSLSDEYRIVNETYQKYVLRRQR